MLFSDFGVDHLEDFAEQTNFPWLLSNITDRLTFKPLADGKVTHMLDWNGVKVNNSTLIFMLYSKLHSDIFIPVFNLILFLRCSECM